jgi:hypothetical protein
METRSNSNNRTMEVGCANVCFVTMVSLLVDWAVCPESMFFQIDCAHVSPRSRVPRLPVSSFGKWTAFETDSPRLFSFLTSPLSSTLAHSPSLNLSNRMAREPSPWCCYCIALRGGIVLISFFMLAVAAYLITVSRALHFWRGK